MRACELPRSTAYHLINAMDRRGLRRPPRRRAPLRPRRRGLRGRQRLRPPGAAAADRPPAARRAGRPHRRSPPTWRCCTAATCSTSLEERAPGRPPLVTDVGVRLPAHLTASGRAILARAARRPGAGALPRRASRSWTAHGRGPATPRPLRTAARRDPAAGLRDRGRRGDPRAGQRRRGGPRPQRLPGRRDRDHPPVRPRAGAAVERPHRSRLSRRTGRPATTA